MLLRGLEELPGIFFGSLPNFDSVVPIILRPYDILAAIERSLKTTLNCYNCSAYVFSNVLVPTASSDSVTYLVKSGLMSRSTTMNEETDEAPVTMGLMGRALSSKTTLMVDDAGTKTALNPTVDLDPVEFQLFVAPIMDFKGTTLGCVEVVFDLNRSRAFVKGARNSSREDFIEPKRLVESYAARLFQPLEYALGFINSQFIPPRSREALPN